MTAMTDNPLKTVLVLDAETQWYKPVAHNLSAAQAVDVVTQQTAEGKTTKAIDQERHHRTIDAAKCKSCKEAALHTTDDAATHVPDSDVREAQE
jgi:hypothetical protein